MARFVACLFLLSGLMPCLARGQTKFTISGFIREKDTRELLPGVTVYVEGTPFGTAANSYGFYSLTLPAATDTVTLTVSYIGFEPVRQPFRLNRDIAADFWLTPSARLDEVTVSGKKAGGQQVFAPQMSKVEVPIAQLRKIPAFLGEKDVLRVLQLMPGVQKGSEGQTGLYVRGGGPDQNLVILDDAVVYNASHLFGFFSIFNSDALKSVELTKGGFPARYGGRLSSVLEMNMKEGSKEKLKGEGGIGLVASRLTLEGPLAKGRTSFLVSGRRTYIDLLARPLIAHAQRNDESKVTPGYYFYDLNAKVNYDFGDRNKLYLSGYFGRDRFYANEKSSGSAMNAGLAWGNATGTLRWNHLYNQRLFSNTSFIFSRFNFRVDSDSEEFDSQGASTDKYSLIYDSNIRDWTLKTDFDYFPSPQHEVKFGLIATLHKFVPSALTVKGDLSDDPIDFTARPVNSVESALYAEDNWQPFDRLKINAGLRLAYFRTPSKHYFRPEPRWSSALRLPGDLSFKTSYAEMNQFVHMLSNTGLGLPTDLWVPTTDLVAPQHSRQVAAGFARELERTGLTLSLEGYYKYMNHIISYKEGASFLSIDGENARELNWEDNITSGKGWSYGAELLLQKKEGRFSGWIGYTLSWTNWKFPELNNGRMFHPRYDRRHDISVVGIYEISRKITLSAVWVYGTGNALTVPLSTYDGVTDDLGKFGYRGGVEWFGYRAREYGEKNSFRAEPYHRFDLSVQFHKKKKGGFERTWEIGAYNLYNRKNPFFYNITRERIGQTDQYQNVLKRYSIFPVIPSVSYNFKF